MKLLIKKNFVCYIGTELREYIPGTTLKTQIDATGKKKIYGTIENPEMEEIKTLVDDYKVAVPIIDDEKKPKKPGRPAKKEAKK